LEQAAIEPEKIRPAPASRANYFALMGHSYGIDLRDAQALDFIGVIFRVITYRLWDASRKE